MRTCYIFGAANGKPRDLIKKDGDIIIAADAGYKMLNELNIIPDIVLGDFDSLGFVPKALEIIKHPVRKDDTDTLLAVKVGLDRGFKRFVLYGCTGGRIDHSLANFQTLSFISSNGGEGYLCGDDFTATAICESGIKFSSKAKGSVSVFSATTECENVNINGLLYPLSNASLRFDFPLGVSNEFIEKESEISIGKGTAIIVWQGPLSFVK
ncbi:MAG: thiamine diphosphokinase [Clostridia bacterium]|nr:thiamine diphosphokinase [Clostridia bacterium]